ncbi:LysM peptidoglycan-binding domain-containing protein [Lutimaribacter marinistellae]|uniref:LysM peptidoglycan-binding domain-containing protein n=1 Tax=Lutimaribacter marinistellae TaxID=1820329 RepID=A0ABV7TNV8_9RHOB
MAADGDGGGTGTFAWGALAGVAVLAALGALYASGVFDTDRQDEGLAPVASDEAAQEPAAPEQLTKAPEVGQTAPQPPVSADPAQTETSDRPVASLSDETQPLAPSGSQLPADEAAPALPDRSGPAEPSAAVEEQPTQGNEDDAPYARTPETATLGDEAAQDDTVEPLDAPSLDQIYVEPDGTALLAGRAAPGSEVVVLVNGAELHRFTSSGSFAEFLTIPFNERAQGLVLRSEKAGRSALSDDYLIAALPAPATPPTNAQDQVAAADPEPNPQAEDAPKPQANAQAEPDKTQQGEADSTEDGPAESAGDDIRTTTATDEGGEEAALQLADAPQTPTEPEAETAKAAPDLATDSGPVAILRSGREGVELLQPAPADPQVSRDQVALDTIGYSDEGEVNLSGRAQSGSTVRVYVDNRAVSDIPAGLDGEWRADVPGIDPGIYTLRLDEIDAAGAVVSRIETPFKREPPEALLVPVSEAGVAAGTAAIQAVTVQHGDTLWAISRERYGEGVLYVKVFEANRGDIRDPDLIYPGQIFTLPE